MWDRSNVPRSDLGSNARNSCNGIWGGCVIEFTTLFQTICDPNLVRVLHLDFELMMQHNDQSELNYIDATSAEAFFGFSYGEITLESIYV